MMTQRTPTAEEVLGLYLSHLAAITKHRESQGEDAIARWDELMQATSQLDSAITRWQAAKGPVTREWFVERFGGTEWNGGHIGLVWGDRVIRFTFRAVGVGYFSRPLHNPTRADIEMLVQVLGGSGD